MSGIGAMTGLGLGSGLGQGSGVGRGSGLGPNGGQKQMVKTRERARRQLTNSQRQVDVVAEEGLQLELLTQSQMEGSAIHG